MTFALVDYLLCLVIISFLFFSFCRLYQRNFIICDKYLFQKNNIKTASTCFRCLEKKFQNTEYKILEGFSYDTHTMNDIHYLIIYNKSFTKTLFYCHGNSGSIDRHVQKCITLMTELNVNIILFDYAGFGQSSGYCVTEHDMFLNALAVYEDIHIKYSFLRNTNIFIYGISLGGVCALLLALYLNKKCHGLILENSLYSLSYLFKKSNISIFKLIPNNWIHSQFCIDKYLCDLDIELQLPVLVLCALHDKVLCYKNSLKIYDILNNIGMKNVSYVRLDDIDIGHTNAWKFGSLYFNVLNRLLSPEIKL